MTFDKILDNKNICTAPCSLGYVKEMREKQGSAETFDPLKTGCAFNWNFTVFLTITKSHSSTSHVMRSSLHSLKLGAQ